MTSSFFRSSILLAGLLCLVHGSAFAASEDSKAKGDRLLLEQKPEAALREYEKALEAHPDSTAVLFNMAIAFYSEGKIQEAISALEKAAALNPGDVEAGYNLGCLWLEMGDIAKAELLFKEAALHCPEDSEFYPRLADGLGLIEELKETNPSAQDLLSLVSKHGFPARNV
ncbi:MAG TPA: tetratricopeptide repeat protein [Verrucomicrobiae bacterium]|jgi:tetratricopeptide (TPR) repeat protein|nr:tetratricopeptide repeat protein [Verrucomicrobiae bacterium]